MVWVALSGKIASGKDTIAAQLELPGGTVVVGHGDIVRRELAPAMSALLDGTPCPSLGVPAETTARWSRLLRAEYALDPSLTPWTRTPGMRLVLQELGVRMDIASKVVVAAGKLIEQGKSVVSVGTRFPQEAQTLRAAGALIVRIDVSFETQMRRLVGRDGPQTTESLAALNHPGETLMDTFDFDVRISNDVEGLSHVVARQLERRVLWT